MRSDLENYFYKRIKKGFSPRFIIEVMMESGKIKSRKQAYATLKKWTNKGYYNYGVSLDLGWITSKERKPR